MIEHIYLDYAATTPVSDIALAAAMPFYKTVFYNPSSTHALGQKSAAAVERAREKCAAAIGACADEIYFTSGGTEAINWAMSQARTSGKKRIAVSTIEHDAVLACAEALKSVGFIIDYVKPDAQGIITPEAVENAVTEETALCCVMTVNNIVGTIQPVKQLAAAAHKKGALFFTDAVQAVNSLELNVKEINADMLAVSGHKFYAPKGIGFLYVKRGVKIPPLLKGGEQEKGLRAGTLDVPSIVAMGEAIELAADNRNKYTDRASELSAAFLNALDYGTPILCNQKTADILSVVFEGINGGRLAVALSLAGLCCSVGSACSAGSATPPRTLSEMGVEHPECAVRFSFGSCTTLSEVKNAAAIVNETVKRLNSGK